MSLNQLFSKLKGGPGSGNRGHSGGSGGKGNPGGSSKSTKSVFLSKVIYDDDLHPLDKEMFEDEIDLYLDGINQSHLQGIKSIRVTSWAESGMIDKNYSGLYNHEKKEIIIPVDVSEPAVSFRHELGEHFYERQPQNFRREFEYEFSHGLDINENKLGLKAQLRTPNDVFAEGFRVWAEGDPNLKNSWSWELPDVSKRLNKIFKENT